MSRVAPLAWLTITQLLLFAPGALAQAGGGSSGFGGGGGGGGGGGSYGGGGQSGGGDDPLLGVLAVAVVVLIFAVCAVFGLIAKRRRAQARAERDERVTTASAEAAEEDPVFAAGAVKTAAGALYVDVQRAWSERDDETLARLLGPDLLVEWRRRLADFAARGWANEVAIRSGPHVGYVGLVNRDGAVDDRVTVTMTAKLHSVVRTSDGVVVKNKADTNGDGVIDVCEYWTLDRAGDRWRLVAIEQEREGAHHLQSPIVTAPWSDDARIADESLVELAAADAPPPGVRPSELVSVAFDGSAREQALDLALADPRCAPDLLEVAARRAVEAWAEAVDGDDAALLAVATPEALRALLYPDQSATTARVVVRGPRLLRLAITALHAGAEPLRMEVEARVRGRRYVEDRDTVAVLSGSKQRETEFTERWTFTLDGPADAPWRLVSSAPSEPG